MQDCAYRSLAAVLAVFVITTSAAADPIAQKRVDPLRYAGRWYEVARLPNKLQANCVSVTADWARGSDGVFDVTQTCHTGPAGSEDKTLRASGRFVDTATSATFRMEFLGGLIQRDYLIVDRADDYSWCMLTMPNPKYLWIMSRKPDVSPTEKAALVAHAHGLGYDVTKLVFDNAPSA